MALKIQMGGAIVSRVGQSRTSRYSTRRGQGNTTLLISLALLCIGIGVVGYGMSTGLRALHGLYSGAVTDALGQPEGTEEQVSTDILKGVVIAAAGVIPLMGGTVFFYARRARRARSKRITNNP